jgi:hypothetical protein
VIVIDVLRHRAVARSSGRLAMVAVATGLGVLLTGAVGARPAAAATTDASAVTIRYTSVGEHEFTVPAGVFSVHVVAIGGKGGDLSGYSPGGRGARVEADLAVKPGQVLYAEVGGAGTTATMTASMPAVGGDNGGGVGGMYVNSLYGGGAIFVAMSGAAGGGSSDVRTRSRSIWGNFWSSRLLVAAGGGGAGADSAGGAGGAPNGQGAVGATSGSPGGGGATTSAAGVGGTIQNSVGGSGSLGAGGNGGLGAAFGGGGGGGGYYGGGGGSGGAYQPADLSGGGGGGSSYGPAGTQYSNISDPASVSLTYQASFAVRLASALNPSMSLNVWWGSLNPGATVLQYPTMGLTNEVWIFTPTGGYYEIINKNSGQCLTTDGVAGHTLYQWPCGGASLQLWQVPPTFYGNTASWIKNPATGLYLDIFGGSIAAGGTIDAWPWNGGTSNQYFFAQAA